jgi:4-hydroxy-tetrahydrodipicolinate synthase
MKAPALTGTYTALITPFTDDQLEVAAFKKLIQLQIRGGVDGIVPVGTTGESPTLDYAEHLEVIRLAVKFAGGKLKVMAGTGGNSTNEAIYLTREAEQLGADASLQVAPYYNKPTQEGLFQHFSAIARATKLPIMLYSIPGRCGVEIAVPTVQMLAKKHRNIVGIKEAGGNADRVSQLRQACGPGFTILSGDDGLTLPFMAREVAQMVRAFAAGKPQVALALHERLYPLFKNLFVETNPSPCKAALALLGLCSEEVRLPLVPVTDGTRKLMRATLKQCGLLK